MSRDDPDFTLRRAARPGEDAAGSVFMRGRGIQVFQQVFLVITGTRLEFFESKTREFPMHIVLAGCIAKPNTLRTDSRNAHYFVLMHPTCGTREFYVTSRKERDLWLTILSDCINRANKHTLYGFMYKLGGMSGQRWVKRWAAIVNDRFMYFEDETSCDARGVISLSAASIMSIKTYVHTDMQFSFELVTVGRGKAMKSYHFALEKSSERDRWVKYIQKALRTDAIRSREVATSGSSNIMI